MLALLGILNDNIIYMLYIDNSSNDCNLYVRKVCVSLNYVETSDFIYLMAVGMKIYENTDRGTIIFFLLKFCVHKS